ncbi:MAG: NAD(P)-dependent oxidoreductase [Planctomycetaceae bacterium]
MHPDHDPHIGVIGLGLMGTAITERLLQFGWQPHIWNRSPEKIGPLAERGAIPSNNPIADCRRVIISLYSSDVVEQVLGQFLPALQAGQILIDTTTGSPEFSEQLAARLQQSGAALLDAPISGSSEQTRRGEACVIVGGEPDIFQQCRNLWPVLGSSVFHVGCSGSAARMKLVTNLVLGLNRAALAEGLVYAASQGISPSAALEVLRGSAAYSRQMDTKGAKMIAADYSVQARLSQHLKDVRLIVETAAAAGLSLALTNAHQQLLEQAETLGFGASDNSAVLEAIRARQQPPANS